MNKTLLPKLRFPEFESAEEWEVKELSQITRQVLDGDWIESKDQSSSGVRLVQTGNVGIGEFISKDGSARYVSEDTFNRLNCTEIFPNDCLVSRLPDPIGRACLVPDTKQRMITAVDCAIVRFDYQQIIPYIFVLYSQTNYYLDRVNSLGSGSTRKRISRENLSHIEIPFPSIPEQQKIADCLTSLDDLIAAQSQKVEALGDYKKGLMQNLFPAEGESVPRLRFPEFESAGEWETTVLSEVYSFKVTNSFSRDQLNYTNGSVKNIHYGDIHMKFSTLFDIAKETVPYINPSQSIEAIKIDSYCIEGDMIFADASEDLNDVGKSIEIVNLNNEKLVSGMHTLLARQITPRLAIGFGGYLFKSDRIRTQIKKEAQGAKVLGISSGRLSSIEICFPSDKREQQRIAELLSAIDEEISAQGEALAGLKVHKKGLMQGLFPSMSGAG